MPLSVVGRTLIMRRKALIVIIISLSLIGIVIFNSKSYSGYDYIWFEPGHYLHYTETYDAEIKDLEVVYQETVTDGIFMTFNFLDRKSYDSSLLGGSARDKIRLSSGYPASHEFILWYLINLPKSFNDGDTWKNNGDECRVDYIGDWGVKGTSFSDVIKISINSLNRNDEYTRGEGEAYIAKDIGIIDWEFRKVDGRVFKIEIEDWGELPPRIISGRLTLDVNYPAAGYHIGLSNKHVNDATSKITDEMGKFSFIAYGHKLTLRCAPLLSGGGLDWDERTEYELVDIDSDVTDLVLSLRSARMHRESDLIFLAYNYFPTEPGRYIKFHVSDTNSEDCEFEMAFQNILPGCFSTTLTQTSKEGGRWGSNALLGREERGILIYYAGCPSRNRGHLFMDFSIPITFNDGDTWDSYSIPLFTVNLLDNRTVSHTNFEDCIKISFKSGDGECEFYLARGVGIIELVFRRWDGTIFTAKAIEWGKLNPITISGRLTLDGTRPAEGYGVCLSICGELGGNIDIVDEYGRFALEAFGHSIIIRYGPIREDGFLYSSTKIEQKFDDVIGDITGLELSMGLPP